LPAVIEVRDPAHFLFFDRHGVLLPTGLAGSMAAGLSLNRQRRVR
jgi:hypothetical protein